MHTFEVFCAKYTIFTIYILATVSINIFYEYEIVLTDRIITQFLCINKIWLNMYPLAAQPVNLWHLWLIWLTTAKQSTSINSSYNWICPKIARLAWIDWKWFFYIHIFKRNSSITLNNLQLKPFFRDRGAMNQINHLFRWSQVYKYLSDIFCHSYF